MRLLLDTHVFLWWLANNETLSAEANRAILDRKNRAYISSISVFEVRLKEAIRKITLAADWWEKLCEQDFDHLAFSTEHADATRAMPLHHRDPFDRMLIAQAVVEDMVFVTRDRALRDYSVKIIVA